MRIDVVTLFPAMIESAFQHSLMKRAIEKKLFDFYVHNLRLYTSDKHKTCDDLPFGGGEGMVMKIEPIYRAIEDIAIEDLNTRIILTSPGGKVFTQQEAKRLINYDQLVFICGHYEGVDARVQKYLVDEELSIGDYVLTGGELPSIVMIDAIARLIPGVVGDPKSLINECFEDSLLDFPQYTRPRSFRDMDVPVVLLSGNHKEIDKYRKEEALRRTLANRPDLLDKKTLTKKEEVLISQFKSFEETDENKVCRKNK